MKEKTKKKAAGANGGQGKHQPNKSYAGSNPETIPDAIAKYAAARLSVVPIDSSTKRPKMSLLPRDKDDKPTWRPFSNEIAGPEWLKRWAESGVDAIAVVGGQVSGGLCILDFDVPRFYEAWKKAVGEMAKGLPTQRTGGGGYQVFYRCPNACGNEKLAWAPDDTEESGRTIAIETRGEGGYAVVPPSLHPSGNYYEIISGNLTNVPTITQDRADALIKAARDLDEMPHTAQQLKKIATQARNEHKKSRSHEKGTGVIDKYDDAHTVDELLTKHDYTLGSSGRYIRPGGNSESVWLVDGWSCHFSTNDPLNDGKFGAGKCGVHSPFGLYCELDHAGDVNAAVKAAAKELGIAHKPGKHPNDEVHLDVGDPTNPIRLVLQFDVCRGDNGSVRGRVTVKRDGQLLHEDHLDLSSAQRRAQFSKAVAAKCENTEGEEGNTDGK